MNEPRQITLQVPSMNSRAFWITVALLLPFFAMALVLSLTRSYLRPNHTDLDWAGIIASTLIGAIASWKASSDHRRAVRMAITVLYIPVVALILLFYSLMYVCFVIGDCV